MSLKNPATPLGIDPGTLRIVSQCLNHYATPGPGKIVGRLINNELARIEKETVLTYFEAR